MRPVIFGAQRDYVLPAFQHCAARRPTVLVRQPEALDVALLEQLDPEFVFLPDWSWLIPADWVERWCFVGFHPAALPAFRGGSPLQHQILAGIQETTLSAFRIAAGIDDGPIFFQRPLSLAGSIAEIWERSAGLLPEMIDAILAGAEPRPQNGTGRVYRRRRPAESRLPDLRADLSRLYDFIRMLDDPYPNAFLEQDGKRLRFRKARLQEGCLQCEVLIDVP